MKSIKPAHIRAASRTKRIGPPDRWLFLIVVSLSIFGVLMVYDSSVAIAMRDFGNQYFFLFEQLKWLGVGVVGMMILSYMNYKAYYPLAFAMLMGTIGALIAVFLPGIGVHALGAHRWINLGITTLQPAEFAKLSMIMYLAAWFSTPEKGRLGSFLLLMGMVVGLILLEPDMGTSIILVAIALVLYFFSGAPTKQFAFLIPVVGAAVLVLAVIAPYRFARLTTFLNPDADPKGASYQIKQVLVALGSGGMFGVGIGKSRQKYEYLPEANTDSIFAIIGEEIGFVGAVVFLSAFLFVLSRGFRIAKFAPDPFGRLLALGITSWIGIQAIINLSAMVALMPLTGVPLPFISYGGSNLIVSLWSVGILLNISRGKRV